MDLERRDEISFRLGDRKCTIDLVQRDCEFKALRNTLAASNRDVSAINFSTSHRCISSWRDSHPVF
ncbi:MAG: hypothetical protein ACP5D4_12580 [Baaleninema sp.]